MQKDKPSSAWLIDEYIEKRRTCNDIAKDVGKDPKTVWSWLKSYGIPVRPRGGASSSGSFKKGVSTWKGKTHSVETKMKIREARLRDGRVPYLKNGEHWLKASGSTHPMWKGGVTPERQALYASVEWADAVKSVWSRDNATCQRCGKHHNAAKTRGTFHIHHIASFMVRELRAEVSNLILLCEGCHRWVHSKENAEKLFIKE